MGFRLVKFVEIKNVSETDIPDDAIDNYKQFEAGFGEIHSFP
jgi:hypothetical protein